MVRKTICLAKGSSDVDGEEDDRPYGQARLMVGGVEQP